MNAKALLIPVAIVIAIPAYHYVRNLPPDNRSTPLPPASLQVRTRIRLNDATREDLLAVRGIGDSLAGKILKARPASGFRTWNEVDAVSGVGPATLKRLQDYFEVP